MEPIPVTPEVEFLVNRRNDLKAQTQKAWETYQALHGAIQECENTISALAKIQMERNKKVEVPESMPENKENVA
jgi:chaperonin cofactor prefoldin